MACEATCSCRCWAGLHEVLKVGCTKLGTPYSKHTHTVNTDTQINTDTHKEGGREGGREIEGGRERVCVRLPK